MSDFVSYMCKDDHCNDDGTFYFETTYAALNGNTDYTKLMKTLCILEAQRQKILKDVRDLEELELKAAENPLAVKQEILDGQLPFLNRITVEKVPEPDFSKYSSVSEQTSKNPPTRKKQEIKVRGRVYNEKKPQTFNQLWTTEEQLRLEQLLIDFPPEPIEFRRFEKIAEALGSRTPQQVCSRVQKYYKKLEKAGIRTNSYGINARKKRANHVHKRNKHFLYKPSTFFPGADMGELEETDSDDGSSHSDPGASDLSHWKDIRKKIKEDKDNEELRVEHIGFKCEKCKTTPIVGIRWECKRCPEVNFCSKCMSSLCKMTPPPHPITHHFRPIEFYINSAYATDSFSCDNYLDPNAHVV